MIGSVFLGGRHPVFVDENGYQFILGADGERIYGAPWLYID